MDLAKINKIYFIGIGGIGISAAARILRELGKNISGSDATESEITTQLQAEGIDVFIPQVADNIPADADLVVYTVAIAPDNPELIRARELPIAEMTYPQLLGLLMKDQYGIGVSGTDGKTTTTAMLGKIFISADLDPTIVVGSKVDYLNGNARVGRGKYFIFESDEYKRAFANYSPRIAIVTNVRADHLDVYKDLADIKSAFIDYLNRVPTDGFVIINADDNNCSAVAKRVWAKVISYGIDNPAEVTAKDIQVKNGRQTFKVFAAGRELGEAVLVIPGRYNVYNALAAITAALQAGIDFEIIKKALGEFSGAWRRFEKLGQVGATEIITDYAHTPEGVRQTIAATKEFYPEKKILFVFQPHQFNRTKNFFSEFASAFTGAGNAIISDIFYVPGRENPDDFDVNSQLLAAKAGVAYGGDLKRTEAIIREKIGDFDVIMIMGAGNIYSVAKNILKLTN